MSADVITIPYSPRKWAMKLHSAMQRWIVLVLHRRAGKTTAILNHHQRAALDNAWESARLRALLPAATDSDINRLLKRRVYWHVMPTFSQGKKTGAWDTLKEIARVVPGSKPNESEMLMTYPNGNKVQILGADNPDSLRGPGLSGLSLDEYSQIPGNAFGEVLSKSLADHVGYCIFSGTIKGTDQLFKLHESGKDDPDWFAFWQNIDGSLATEDGATIDALRRALEDDRKLVAKGTMTQAEFDQEWYLSPEAAIKGSFYGPVLKKLRDDGHILRVPYDPTIPVDTDWDLGVDTMAVWFSQSLRNGEIRLIDYWEASMGVNNSPLSGLPLAIKALKERPYVYGEHWAPHDIEQRDISGLTQKQTARNLGIYFKMTPKLSVAEGIQAAQMILNRCYFDEKNCEFGLERLRNYRRQYVQRHDTFTEQPIHDSNSHCADAFRTLAVRHKTPKPSERFDLRDPVVHRGYTQNSSQRGGWML